MRLVLHTATYWLALALRDAISEAQALAEAEFNTIRLRLPKPGTRVTEFAGWVHIAFAIACPDVAIFLHLEGSIRSGAP